MVSRLEDPPGEKAVVKGRKETRKSVHARMSAHASVNPFERVLHFWLMLHVGVI